MYKCECCSDCFTDEEDCEEHMDEYDHWPECEACPKTFRTWRACNQHMNDTDHWARTYECETCTKEFRSWNAANQHMNALRHWAPKVPCETCDKKFHTQSAADQHMEALGHYWNYCKACDRHFMNENNLKMHLNSKVHRGTSITCPVCGAQYTTASGLTHHLESGSCPQAQWLNREIIHAIVSQRDRNGAFTSKQIGWLEQSDRFTPTNRAFNGSFWECYICHREFSTAAALSQHANSPVHKQKIYHCPNRSCEKEFTSLAGLFNHLESESCGFMRFEKVQRKVVDVFEGRKLITFK